jgi:hypothetical protein
MLNNDEKFYMYIFISICAFIKFREKPIFFVVYVKRRKFIF